jgi:hypothetical protein
MSIELKRIGYWSKTAGVDPEPWAVVADALRRMLGKAVGLPLELPDPREFIDTHWLDTQQGKMEFKAVLAHLSAGTRQDAYFGYHTCLLCGQDAGYQDLTDGVYVWPEGYAHYVQEHGVKPPQDFIDHVLSKAWDALVRRETRMATTKKP